MSSQGAASNIKTWRKKQRQKISNNYPLIPKNMQSRPQIVFLRQPEIVLLARKVETGKKVVFSWSYVEAAGVMIADRSAEYDTVC